MLITLSQPFIIFLMKIIYQNHYAVKNLNWLQFREYELFFNKLSIKRKCMKDVQVVITFYSGFCVRDFQWLQSDQICVFINLCCRHYSCNAVGISIIIVIRSNFGDKKSLVNSIAHFFRCIPRYNFGCVSHNIRIKMPLYIREIKRHYNVRKIAVQENIKTASLSMIKTTIPMI